MHRDLKPENVFLERDPDDAEADLVKVLDFGIAKTMERDAEGESPPSSEPMSAPPSSVLTRVGSIVGTPEYMAPEQAMGLTVDARTDVYACGVLLFHLITGRQPFVGQTPIEVLVQLNDQPPPAPSSLVPGIHPALEQLILTALAKSPEQRPQSARALRTALEALLPELGAGKHRPAVAPASTAKIAGLPGVPGQVAISTDPRSVGRDPKTEGDEPPAPLRPLRDEDARSATSLAATLASEGTSPIAEAIASSERARGAAVQAGPELDADDGGVREAKACSNEPASIRKAPPESARGAISASSARGGWIVPPWVLLGLLAAVVAVLWLVSGAR